MLWYGGVVGRKSRRGIEIYELLDDRVHKVIIELMIAEEMPVYFSLEAYGRVERAIVFMAMGTNLSEPEFSVNDERVEL